MSKKKKKKKKEVEYDYTDIHCDEVDLRKSMKGMSKSLQLYMDTINNYAILEGVKEEKWKEDMRTVDRLIKKLKEGDPSVFNNDSLNEYLDNSGGRVSSLGPEGMMY